MGETYATGFVNPKTTSLFFDKLYIPKKVITSPFGRKNEFDKIPKEILFNFIPNLDEIFGDNFRFCCSRNARGTYDSKYEIDIDIDIDPIFIRDKLALLDDSIIEHKNPITKKVITENLINNDSNCGEFLLSVFRNRFILKVAKEIKKNSYIKVVPIFFDKTDFEKSLIKEKVINDNNLDSKNVYEALITCDYMIDESKLTWEQVLEIRRDKAEQAKLKRFRSWINSDFDNCSKEQIIDKINNTYSDYAEALKKHGVKTLTGSLATVVTEAAIGVLSTWGGNTVNYIGLGLQLAIGAIPLGKTVMDYVKLRKEPIAYYYDIKKKI